LEDINGAKTAEDVTAAPDPDEWEQEAGDMWDEQESAQEPDQESVQESDPLRDALERLLRLSADFDNYRKRSLREREEWVKYAAQNLIEKLLPIMDSMDRAIESVEIQSEEMRNNLEGFRMIQRQLLEVLQKEGLSEIEAMDQIFDPVCHEAVMQAPAEENQEDNQIVEVLRKGYRYHDRVLRAAMVKVAKKDM
jgi:molecular chaperone GrpE